MTKRLGLPAIVFVCVVTFAIAAWVRSRSASSSSPTDGGANSDPGSGRETVRIPEPNDADPTSRFKPDLSPPREPASPANPALGAELIHRFRVFQSNLKSLRREVARAENELKELRDRPENEDRRRVLRATLEDLRRRLKAEKMAAQENHREIRRWLSENPVHPPAYYRELRNRMSTEAPGRAGFILAGHYDNAELESMVLGDLQSGTDSLRLLALEVVAARATPARVGAVSEIALRNSPEKVRESAVQVLGNYKEDPEAVRQRNEIFSVLTEALQTSDHAGTRVQALVGLGRERSPTDSLRNLVKGIAEKDPDNGVRAVARQLLRRWGSR